MRRQLTPEQLEAAARVLKQLSELAQDVAEVRAERDRLIAQLFELKIATTGQLCTATGLSPNRIRAIAAEQQAKRQEGQLASPMSKEANQPEPASLAEGAQQLMQHLGIKRPGDLPSKPWTRKEKAS
jgi:hypothetical protein